MTVTFVPPRTFIRASGPTTTITSTADYMLDQDESQDLYEEMDMDGMDEHGGGSLLTKKLVVPGQLVTDDPQFMRYGQSCVLEASYFQDRCLWIEGTGLMSEKKKK
jgi:hypothetical protein